MRSLLGPFGSLLFLLLCVQSAFAAPTPAENSPRQYVQTEFRELNKDLEAERLNVETTGRLVRSVLIFKHITSIVLFKERKIYANTLLIDQRLTALLHFIAANPQSTDAAITEKLYSVAESRVKAFDVDGKKLVSLGYITQDQYNVLARYVSSLRAAKISFACQLKLQ